MLLLESGIRFSVKIVSRSPIGTVGGVVDSACIEDLGHVRDRMKRSPVPRKEGAAITSVGRT